MEQFCDPMDCHPSGSFVHGLLQARILEWVAIPFSRGSSQPRDWTLISCLADRFFTIWATREGSPSIEHHSSVAKTPTTIYYISQKHFTIYFLKKNWRIIALQCCASLCHTTTWIGHKFTYIPSLLSTTPTHNSLIYYSLYTFQILTPSNEDLSSCFHMNLTLKSVT